MNDEPKGKASAVVSEETVRAGDTVSLNRYLPSYLVYEKGGKLHIDLPVSQGTPVPVLFHEADWPNLINYGQKS